VTETQTRVFTFIKGYLAAYRIPPTLVEIAEACGLSSTGSVRYVLDALEDQGKISRQPKIARSIVVEDR
jgi:SOS-response transcriptional repressor LexA